MGDRNLATVSDFQKHGKSKGYEKYQDYKQSQIEWLGRIPSNWELSRIKHLFYYIGSGTTPSRSEDDYYDGNIGWVNSGDLNDGVVKDCNERITDYALNDHSALKLYPPKSLIVAMYGATKGKVGLLDFSSTINQACCALVQPKENVATKFVFYSLIALRENLISLSYGGGQDNINQDTIKNFYICQPSLEEQKSIVEFLDTKIGKINELVEGKEELIDLIKEREEALITKLTTRGRNSDNSIEEANDEIIGELPNYWEESNLGNITIKLTNGYVGPTRDILKEDGVPYIQSTHIDNGEIIFDEEFFVSEEWSRNHQTSELREGDVLLVQTGDVGESAVVRDDLDGANCHALIIARPVSDVNSNYLNLFLESRVGKNLLKRTQTGATLKHLNTTRIKDVTIPVPPIDEQEKIVECLESERERFDSMISQIEEGLERLKEYKKALIVEAVTGQIDVRGEV